MSCKNCFHYEVCVKIRKPTLYGIDENAGCEQHFKDKFKFIELPCPIGETVYMISTGCDDWTGHDFKMIIQAPFRLDMLKKFNKTVFLTREEAEKQLEELK